jgi:sugar lactone lactonase YvrE
MPRVWSVLATSGTALGQVSGPTALAVDAAGDLYVADQRPARSVTGRVQKRDAQGSWSTIATTGTAPGDVLGAAGLAVDPAGNLYVTDQGYYGQIQERDVQGNWSLIAGGRTAPGPVVSPAAVAADAAGDLYVADQLPSGTGVGRVQKRDAQGSWSLIATAGEAVGQVRSPTALAVNPAGDLYVGEFLHPCWDCGSSGRIQKRDVQGNWSVIATEGGDLGQVGNLTALAADSAGNLYVADHDNAGNGRIEERDAQGSWSAIATYGTALGQVVNPGALAVDTAGNLYVADSDIGRIQNRDLQGNWSVVAAQGATALAADAMGNLYLAGDNLQRRDAQGLLSVIAPAGAAVGQVSPPTGLAVDSAGHLDVADTGNNRVQEYTPLPGP